MAVARKFLILGLRQRPDKWIHASNGHNIFSSPVQLMGRHFSTSRQILQLSQTKEPTNQASPGIQGTSVANKDVQEASPPPLKNPLAPLDEKTQQEYFKDFRFYTEFQPPKSGVVSDPRFVGVRDGEEPLVLLFGWAGANKKNLEKYTDIYRRAGCLTLSYNLPTRFIFEITSQVPYLADKLVGEVVKAGLANRPTFIHLLSDTGVMVHQGLDIALRQRGLTLDMRGMVLDSCPGERPKLTVAKAAALLIVYWVCARRDGLSYPETLTSEARLLTTRYLPALARAIQGKQPQLSEMEGIWSGDSIRMARPDQNWPELFLYSNSDFYVPSTFIEEKVIAEHAKAGRDITAKRWEKSAHVCHLKKHRVDYEDTIHRFLDDKYFADLRS